MKTAPSSPPRIIQEKTKAEDAHTIRVSWVEIIPKDQNGVIWGYDVLYNEEHQPTVIHDDSRINLKANEAIITGLKPNTSYCIRVIGFTLVGSSPKGDCYYVRTLQSGALFHWL